MIWCDLTWGEKVCVRFRSALMWFRLDPVWFVLSAVWFPGYLIHFDTDMTPFRPNMIWFSADLIHFDSVSVKYKITILYCVQRLLTVIWWLKMFSVCGVYLQKHTGQTKQRYKHCFCPECWGICVLGTELFHYTSLFIWFSSVSLSLSHVHALSLIWGSLPGQRRGLRVKWRSWIHTENLIAVYFEVCVSVTLRWRGVCVGQVESVALAVIVVSMSIRNLRVTLAAAGVWVNLRTWENPDYKRAQHHSVT